MSKFATAQNDFSSGELSPKFQGAFGLKEYFSGVSKLQNFIVDKSRGAFKRCGTRYMGDSPMVVANDTILIPFIFSRTEVYLFEFGVGFLYIYLNGAVTQVLTDSAYDITEGGLDYTQSGDIIFFTYRSGNYAPFSIKRTSLSTFEHIVEKNINEGLAIPYLDENLDDTLLLASDTTGAIGATGNITCRDDNADPFPFFSPEHEGSYFRISNGTSEGIAKISTMVGFSSISNSTMITPTTDSFDVSPLTAEHNMYTGDRVRMTVSGVGTLPGGLAADTDYYIIRISAAVYKLAETHTLASAGTAIDITDVGVGAFSAGKKASTTMPMTVVAPFPTAAVYYATWKESAWSNYQGWPTCVTLYKRRLIYSGVVEHSDTVYNSKQDNYFHFMQLKLAQDHTTDVSGLGYFGPLVDTDAFSYTVQSNQVNAVQWLIADRVLNFGTLGGSYTASRLDDAYGAINLPSVKLQGSTPSKTAAIKVEDGIIFISNDGKRAVESKYSDSSDAIQNREISLLSDQIIYRGIDSSANFNDTQIEQIVWQSSRSILWLRLSNYRLIGVTVSPTTETVAWHWHELGGTDVEIKSMAILPNEDSSWDDLWLVVNRTIDGSTVRYLEKIGGDFEHVLLANSSSDENDHPWFSDSSVRVINSPASATVSGLDHLEGEEVQALVDGVYAGTFTVSGGEITLDAVASEIIVGLQYESIIETMDIEAGSKIGNSQISLSRIDKILLKLYKSLYGQQGNSSSNLYDVEYPDVTANQSYSGNVEAEFDDTPNEEVGVTITHNKPVPFNVLAIIMRGLTED